MQFDAQKFQIQKNIDIGSITSIHYFEFGDDFTDTLESHESWELVYIDRGKCDIIADDKKIVLQQGEMYFHKPFEEHMISTIKGIAPNIFIVTFSTASASMSYFENKKIIASMSTKQHISAIIHEATNTFELPFNTPNMHELKLKADRSLWGGPQTVLIRLELMLIELIRENHYYVNKPKMFYSKEIIEDPFVLKIIAFMESKIYGRFTMSDLCKEFSFGKTYISKCFLNSTGHSVMNYFTIMKLNEAKRLIRETRYNFFEISEMLMFTNAHYFSSVFKKYVGMTPSQYKKSCKTS